LANFAAVSRAKIARQNAENERYMVPLSFLYLSSQCLMARS
jgi:hypothetical protein